jgi:hypothetical protein
MRADKYKGIVDLLFSHFHKYGKGDTVRWEDIERIMGLGRDDLGGRTIVKRLIRDILKRRHITCLVDINVGVRLLTDMQAATEIPRMRQRRAKKQIRKGLKETEYVDTSNLTERASASLAMSRRAMKEEQKNIAQSVKEVATLLKPTQRIFRLP